MAMDERMDVDSEDDEIVASYDIFVKPQLENGKKIYILQFPNRDARQGYSAASSSMPLAVRMKPKSGLMELDVPIETFRNYDREKGIKWGEAVRKSDKSKGNDGGSLGLAGGFGIGAGQPRMRGKAAKDDDFEDMMTQDELLREFERSVGEGRVLGKQTLGGQSIPKDKTTPQYMIGTFRGGKLCFSVVLALVANNKCVWQTSFTSCPSIKSCRCDPNSTISMHRPS
jgi:DNA-directed RNA polymerase-3 subunit RPC5